MARTDAPAAEEVVKEAPEAEEAVQVAAEHDFAPLTHPGDPRAKVPYSVLKDPGVAKATALIERQREQAEKAASASGEIYVFVGPKDKADGTHTLDTDVGRVNRGESIRLPDMLHEQLSERFNFKKA